MTEESSLTSSLLERNDKVLSNVIATTEDNPSRTTTTSETKVRDASKANAYVLTDKATSAFIRRTLCAQHVLSVPGAAGRDTPKPVDELLPPLTSSNEVDLQLYAILAVILKEFVIAWYSKITPDHVFVDEVIQVVAHCTRALEQRVRKVNLEALLLDELPQLVDTHIKSFRVAQEAAYPQLLAHTSREVYHTLVPHPALSPVPRELDPATVLEQARNEESWRQLLVQGVLAVLLPTEDLENGCLGALVAEIFSEMILGAGVSGKACEPWLLWDAITTIIEALQPSTLKVVEKPTMAATRLEQFGLLQDHKESRSESQQNRRGNLTIQGSAASASISGIFWSLVSFAIMAFTAARMLISAVMMSSSLPSRSKAWLTTQSSAHPETDGGYANLMLSDDQRAIISMSVWSAIGRTLDLDTRMPWLAGLLSLSHHLALYGPGKIGDTDGVLDRWLSSKVHEHILNPAYIPRLLKIVRATLFPNNTPGPPRNIPSATEIIAIRRRCAETIVAAVPSIIITRYFRLTVGHAHDSAIDQVEEMLGVLGDAYLNKHLIYNVIELIVVRLCPELADTGVSELMTIRIGEQRERNE